ncbi:MAG: class II fructose-bisphosphate aldolase [Holosporales bacterium]|jgi:fructose-bisphosphate aldolase class II|nr:class II fructose-bisphosphate aldolase [Holosporales bacterium]
MFFHKNIVNTKETFKDALNSKYAIGAFNFSNMEILQAIVETANEEKVSCVIIQVSESAIKYMGMEYLLHMVKASAETSSVPLCLHLDHGKSFDICAQCINFGFSSVMIDNSYLEFDDNIEFTKQVVEYAKSKNVSVEAEVGILSGIEDGVNASEADSFLTDPNQAAEFIEKTGVDSLAISIGTSHGPNKGKTGSPNLNIERLSEIKKRIGKDFPLVLHGASSVYQDITKICNELGMEIKNAFGVKDSDIKEAIKNGIAKINVDTDVRLAFLAGVLESLRDNKNNIDPRKHLGIAKKTVKEVIRRKIRTFLPEY